MELYLPVANMTLGIGELLMLGVCVGVLSGLFGVGGGFISVPLLIFLGVPPAVAIGSQSAQLVGGSLLGYLAYAKRGEVDDTMGVALAVGGLGGSALGAFIISILRHYGSLETAISLVFIFVIGCVGILMFFESVRSIFKHKLAVRPRVVEPWKFPDHPLRTYFAVSHLTMSYLAPVGVGFITGVFVALMGVGGGFFLVPVLIYVFGMTARLVSGTSFLTILLTSLVSTMMHATINHAVDPVLALVLLVGSILGTQAGARMSAHMPGSLSRVTMALLLIGVAGSLLLKLTTAPSDIFSLAVL